MPIATFLLGVRLGILLDPAKQVRPFSLPSFWVFQCLGKILSEAPD